MCGPLQFFNLSFYQMAHTLRHTYPADHTESSRGWRQCGDAFTPYMGSKVSKQAINPPHYSCDSRWITYLITVFSYCKFMAVEPGWCFMMTCSINYCINFKTKILLEISVTGKVVSRRMLLQLVTTDVDGCRNTWNNTIYFDTMCLKNEGLNKTMAAVLRQVVLGYVHQSFYFYVHDFD